MIIKKTYIILLLSFVFALSLGMMTGCDAPEKIIDKAEEEPVEEVSEETAPFFAMELDDNQKLQPDSNMVRILDIKTSDELKDNRIGTLYFMSEDDHIIEPGHVCPGHRNFARTHSEAGFKWVRLGMDHACFDDFNLKERGKSTKLEPRQVSEITAFHEAGIDVICCLIFWDIEAGGQEWKNDWPLTPYYSRFRDEREVERYVDYVRKTVRELKGFVAYYELLNEPNPPRDLYVSHSSDSYLYNDLHLGNQQTVRLPEYASLIERVIPVIREEDPEAKIAVGAVCDIWGIDSPGVQYLLSLFKSGIMPLVDAVTIHPLYNVTPQNEDIQQYAAEVDYEPLKPEAIQAYYDVYPDLLKLIIDTAAENGFEGLFIADEICYMSDSTNFTIYYPQSPLYFPEIQAVKYYARSILLHLGFDMKIVVAYIDPKGQIAETKETLISNLSTVMAGHETIDMPVKIEIYYDGPFAYCTFRNPDGDRMLAVWTDGVAVNEDPGVPATITFPGLKAQSVNGIDVLHGLEHELNFSVEGDSTVVRDILVKDYPSLIRLIEPQMSEDYKESAGPGFHRAVK